MKSFFILLLTLFSLNLCLAQETKYGMRPGQEMADELPSYKGGQKAWNKFQKKHIKYPKAARKSGITGRVFVSFVVNVDGSVSDIKEIKSPDTTLTAEVQRLMNQSPKWIPAKHDGKEVAFTMQMAIDFKL